MMHCNQCAKKQFANDASSGVNKSKMYVQQSFFFLNLDKVGK